VRAFLVLLITFLLMKKNRFVPETLNAFVAIKINSEFDCSEAQGIFLSDVNLLNASKSSEKYVK